MADNHVTVYFQGHDHIFVHQELDGVIYQPLPEPADPNYSLFNANAYQSGDKLPNTGCVRTYLPEDETAARQNGQVAHAYTLSPRQ